MTDARHGGPSRPLVDQGMSVDIPQRTKLEILFAILLGLFLGALDQTIVGTALPRIITDLRGNELYTWSITIYLLTSTISGPFYGKLSDLYGRKPLLMFGIGLFLLGSALSGLSQDMAQFVAFRGLQGLGAGALFPIALAVIGDLFTPAERGKYQGLFGAVFGLSSIIGPALGGFLTDAISWHWIFYVNVPIGLVSLYIIWRLLPTVRRPDIRHRLDYLGAAVFTLAIGSLLVGLTNKQTGEWTDPAVGGLIAIGLALGVVFLAIEARAAEPIVPLELFRIRTYSATILATFFSAFGFFGAVIFLPRYFQFVRGASATESGYQTIALLGGLILGAMGAGQIVARTGRYRLLTIGSLALATVGLLLLTQLRAETPLPVLWLWMFIAGLGIGPSFSVLTIVVQNVVPFDRLGTATSNLTFFRQIGGTVGLTIVGTVFSSRFSAEIPEQLVQAGVPRAMVEQFAARGTSGTSEIVGVGQDLGAQILVSVPAQFRALVEPLVPNIVAGIHEAFSVAIGGSLLVGVAAMLVALGAAVLVQDIPLREHAGPEPETGTEGGKARRFANVPIVE